MVITTKFDVDESVIIIAIDQSARVIEIILSGKNLLYKLEYWWNGEIKTVTQYENELRKNASVPSVQNPAQ